MGYAAEYEFISLVKHMTEDILEENIMIQISKQNKRKCNRNEADFERVIYVNPHILIDISENLYMIVCTY